MKTSQTPQFLDYLHEHAATQLLAEQLAGVLALRGHADLVPAIATDSRRRVAS